MRRADPSARDRAACGVRAREGTFGQSWTSALAAGHRLEPRLNDRESAITACEISPTRSRWPRERGTSRPCRRVTFLESELLAAVPGPFTRSWPTCRISHRRARLAFPRSPARSRARPRRGADGLDLIRRLAVEAATKLAPGGSSPWKSDTTRPGCRQILAHKIFGTSRCAGLSGYRKVLIARHG